MGADLGHQEHAIAAIRNRLSHASLAQPIVVVPGIVEKSDAGIDGRVYQADRKAEWECLRLGAAWRSTFSNIRSSGSGREESFLSHQRLSQGKRPRRMLLRYMSILAFLPKPFNFVSSLISILPVLTSLS